jgi:hypothetical protein
MNRAIWALVAATLSVVLLSGCSAPGGATATTTTTKTPTATPIPPTPVPTKVAGFQDPLTSNANGWPGYCAIKPDGMHQNNPNFCTAPYPAYADGTISVQAKQIKGSTTYGYSLFFRFDETAVSFYAFLIDSKGYWRAFKVANGQSTFFEPFTANAAIHKGLGATNTMMVKVSGSHFDFFVNGAKVGQVDDSSLTTGESGMYGNVGIEVVYTNFSIIPAS